MSTEINPVVGHWYKGADGQPFEVVAIDEKDETIEIQFVDGSVEEFDMDSWSSMDVVAISVPDTLHSLFDNVEHEEDIEQSFFNGHERWSDYFDDVE